MAISDKLKLLPETPGVYIMRDISNAVIYVGKAKNLKNRVKQYFYNTTKTFKVQAMVNNIADFEYVITTSEIDALSLENNLIKKYKPKYNILLKDDKTYPYLKINIKEDYPYFTITRKIKKDGAKYFGPFMGGVSVNEVLEIIKMAFPLRLCSGNFKKNQKVCLNYHINLCCAPCQNMVEKEVYNGYVKKAINFLNGEDKEVYNLLKEKMLLSAENEEFERAQNYKEKLLMLEKISLKRITNTSQCINADIISVAENGIYASANILFVRGGRTMGSKFFAFNYSGNKQEMISQFLTTYYKKGVELPEEIILQCPILDEQTVTTYLESLFDKKVQIIVAKQGIKKQLSNMSVLNAEDYLEKSVDKIKHKNDMTITACTELQQLLSLKNYPKRIECYDISHISGTDKVGSMVVFSDGEKDSANYRRFKIKTIEGNNDFACLQEVLERRLQKLNTEEESKFARPDLIIIDGGKGQLSSVHEIFKKYNVQIDLISLAKRDEEIYTLYSKTPIRLAKSNYVLRLLQRIRDEAHRFAITYHRNLRGKRALSSVLNEIEGLGKVKINALLTHFKDVGEIISASKQQLMQVEGIGEKHAESIIKFFTRDNYEV